MLFTLFVLGSVLLFLVKTVNNKLNNPQDTPFGTNDTEPQEEFKEEFKEEPQVEPQEKPQPKQAYSSYGHLFGLIGKPLGHSTSKDRFNKMFREQHINAYYENFELDSIEQVKDMVDRNPNLCGFNVTIPYKEDIIPYLTRLDETAQAIGAVNTVRLSTKTPEPN